MKKRHSYHWQMCSLWCWVKVFSLGLEIWVGCLSNIDENSNPLNNPCVRKSKAISKQNSENEISIITISNSDTGPMLRIRMFVFTTVGTSARNLFKSLKCENDFNTNLDHALANSYYYKICWQEKEEDLFQIHFAKIESELTSVNLPKPWWYW